MRSIQRKTGGGSAIAIRMMRSFPSIQTYSKNKTTGKYKEETALRFLFIFVQQTFQKAANSSPSALPTSSIP